MNKEKETRKRCLALVKDPELKTPWTDADERNLVSHDKKEIHTVKVSGTVTATRTVA